MSEVLVRVLTNRSDRADTKVLAIAERAASRRGWNCDRVGFESTERVTGHGVVASARADELYRDAHRTRLVVLSRISAKAVRVGAGRPIPMGRLLRYKAYFERVTPEEVEAALTRSDEWCSTTPADRSDPRVLPLHVFAPREDFQDLDVQRGRQRFQNQYNNGRHLLDSKGRQWQVPTAGQMHGQVELAVRGLALGSGFHWDVQGDNRETKLHALTKDVRLPRRGHRNVFPDGCIVPDA